ncbi:hypothetical protein B7463_g577, partial [Scytalidium lignicola]
MNNEASSSRQDRELLKQFLFKIGSQLSSPVATPSIRAQVQRPRIPTQKSLSEAIDAAENPLLLLAQTSEDLSVETELRSPATPAIANGRPNVRSQASTAYNEAFFGPFKPMLDIQPELDPIALGLVDMAEAEQLFSFFYQTLSEMRWGLDPAIHSAKFVHQRSLFLFTSVLAVSALYIPSAGTLSKRLRLHCQKLADVVISKRMRSVEIVLAFMVNVPWLTPGTHWADDETWMYLSAASTIALDISLDKIILHPGIDKTILEWSKSHQSECIDAHKVMDLDQCPDVDITSEWGRRLLRRRERAWLTLWGLERGVCLARGRRWSVPVTPLIEFCDNWHESDIAATWDNIIGPAMVLRRDLLPFIEKLKSGLLMKSAEEPMIDSNLEPDAAVRKQFRAAAFSAALSVLRTAVQREAELMAMPNNSVIMVAFSAAFAIQITKFPEKGTSSLTASVITLISEVANVLERIGTVTQHRNGISALFAVRLRHIVHLASSSIVSKGYLEETSITDEGPTRPDKSDNRQGSSAGFLEELEQPVHFADISIDQINGMIDAMGDDLGVLDWNFDMDFNFRDPDFLDWGHFS